MQNSKWKNTAPVPGDQIRVFRNNYYHHGIFISNDEVIEFGSEVVLYLKETENIKIGKTTLAQFVGDDFLEVRTYSLSEKVKKNSRKKVIEKARSRVGETGYDFLKNNCEHFSYECVFNKKYSEQIEEYKRKLKID